MNYIRSFNYGVVGAALLFLAACSGGTPKQPAKVNEPLAVKTDAIELNPESQQLLKYLEETGDYVNGRNFPSLIKAASVYKELDGKIRIIDLRNAGAFKKGHIKGAVNVEFSQIPNYFTNGIKPFEFDKIVLVCSDGQISSYATSLLRLMGYGNVHAMRWGMSSWNNEFAKDSWFSNVSSKYADQLELTDNLSTITSNFPPMNSGKSIGSEIMATRFNALFAAGSSDIFIAADEVFANPGNFFTMNYERKDKYDAGHIPGSIRYKPNGTLGILSEMKTIPADKTVVAYCGTGHNSAFVAAYLRLFGYNAKALIYGNNAFMYDKMIKDKVIMSWLPFTKEEVADYAFVKN
jgi:rhodanese-related sulfurtransferase